MRPDERVRRSATGPLLVLSVLLVMSVLLVAACGESTPRSTTPRRSTTSAAGATTSPLDLAAQPCPGRAAPATYAHVVVVMLENRTWSQVGGTGFPAMAYLSSLSDHCAFYATWTQTNPGQSSLTQYIGLTSGVDNPRTVDDCSPSASCSSTDDNLFRQVRQSGGTARSYVEGASAPCSAEGNAAKHVPALYYRGTYVDASGTHSDADFCSTEVRPLTELDPDHLPTFAVVTPTLCNDGHDCSNAVVDDWLRGHLGAVLAGRDYLAGATAVFVLWDESAPVPNLVIAPSARPGPRPGTGSHAAALATIERILGLPLLPLGQLPSTGDLRASAPL